MNYTLFDKDKEAEKGPITIEKIANNYNISDEEMLMIFKFWNSASRLKVNMIDLWQNGEGISWSKGVHYALNSIGLSYQEESIYKKRNLPPHEEIN